MTNIESRGERFSHLLGSELKGAISARNWTVRNVAKNINVHHATMSNYFNGSRMLPADVFAKACEVIGVDPADLVDRAYTRLIDELGEYRPADAAVIALYTPPHGIAALDPKYRPGAESDQ